MKTSRTADAFDYNCGGAENRHAEFHGLNWSVAFLLCNIAASVTEETIIS